MEETAQQPIKSVDTQNTSLLFARIESHKNRLKSGPRAILNESDPIKSFQEVLDQTVQDHGLLWQTASHSHVEQFYAVYRHLVEGDMGSYQTVIEKDVTEMERTDQEALGRLLKAYSVYDPQVGYCYGMAHLVSPLIKEMKEEEAFATLIRLMELYDLRDLYIRGPQVILDTFYMLLGQHCPELKHHLDQLRMRPEHFASWFLSLFSQSPLKDIRRLYDHVFLEGAAETCLRLSVHLMQRNERALLRCTQHDLVIKQLELPEFYTWDVQEMMRLSLTVGNQMKQTHDIYQTIARLQNENTLLKMRATEHDANEMKWTKQNTMLEKRVKKYKVKFAEQVVASTVPAVPKEKKKEDHFDSFVESLRETGEFGALVAGAMETKPGANEKGKDEERRSEAALEQVTSDLIALKMTHFETTQRCDELYAHCEHLNHQLRQALESQTAMTQKIIYLTSELEDVTSERDQLYQDQEGVLEMATVAKKTATELVVEKMTLAKQVEHLEQCVSELEQEKQAYFMPRESFSEEVFAAHSILFGQQKTQKEQRRHTMAAAPSQESHLVNEFKTKLVESELRCRELEKYLAEAKVRLAELETSLLYPPVRRASSVHLKRSSTQSMLARVSTPTTEPRRSTESYASSTTSVTSINSSQCNSKRSSMYSRIWNAFGTTATPLKNPILCQEPQII